MIAAGGIGLPPLRPAILRMLARRERYGRLVLLYGGRAPDQLLYTDELDAVGATGPRGARDGRQRRPGVARARRRGHPAGRAAPGSTGGDTVAMACGPEVMMRFTVAALRERRASTRERIYVSMERNMQCGIGHCGHCQLGPTLVCRDGPVYRWSEVEPWLAIREL